MKHMLVPFLVTFIGVVIVQVLMPVASAFEDRARASVRFTGPWLGWTCSAALANALWASAMVVAAYGAICFVVAMVETFR